MRFNYLLGAVGLVIIYIGFVMLVPIVVALLYGEISSISAFLIPAVVCMLLGLILKTVAGNSNFNDIKKSEGLFIVVLSWLLMGGIAAAPFMMMGLSPLNAFFEAASGITTTGGTILTHFDYPHAFFFWRSFTQWLGGMGIIVLFIAILPQFAVAGRQMFFAEAPGPTEDKITPRIRNTASALWKIYVAFTLLETLLLIWAGMHPFDALCNSLSTLSAGGFSPNPESTMGYNSNIITLIIMAFIFISGVSFNVQYMALSKLRPWNIFKSEEVRVYTGVFLVLGGIVAASLYFTGGFTDIKEALLHGYYQVISVMTSTGSTSSDFASWNFTSQLLLGLAFFVGGCASSASGGIKITRWCLVFKLMKTELQKILHPNAVINVKMDNNIVPKDVIMQIIVFVMFYFLIILVSAIVLSILEQNLLLGFASAVSSIGNVGPAYPELIGPLGSFDAMHPVSKVILIFNMYIGRLELIPFLVMLQGDFWNFKKS
ncbi:MAG: TrkH family potassium uptake protein [Fusobacterium sp.]|nr:TrkH family potassium uptake protein [Fusobacterium sp.]